MEEEKDKKKIINSNLGIFIILLFAVVCTLADYIIIERYIRECDCPKCETTSNEVISDNTDNTQVTENRINYPKIKVVKGSLSGANTEFEKIIPTSITINGNIVEYEFQDSINDFAVLDDVVLVNVNHVNYNTLDVIDFNGNIIFKYGGQSNSNVANIHSLTGNIFRGNYKIEGNNLIISSDNLGINRDAFACKAFERNINEGIQFVQKTTYLGNGRFSELSVINTVSVGDFVNENSIDCSWLNE